LFVAQLYLTVSCCLASACAESDNCRLPAEGPGWRQGYLSEVKEYAGACLHFIVSGKGLNDKTVARAVALSAEK